MAVAQDAVSESHTGGSGASSVSSFTWNHVPTGTPRCALVFTCSIGTSPITSVTYGGTTMTKVPYYADSNVSGGERGYVEAWFLDNVASGTQAVVVNRTNNSVNTYANCSTMTASGPTEVYGVKTRAGTTENTGASTTSTALASSWSSISIDDGSPGTNSMRWMGVFNGGSNVSTGGTGTTLYISIDYGLYTFATYRQTTASQGAASIALNTAVSDDLAVVALAVREVPANNRNYNAVLTGGGVATAAINKGALRAQALTGGGVLTVGSGGAATPAVRSTSSYVSTASETTLVVPVPAGVQNGDVLYMAVFLTASTGSITTPGGWNALFTNSEPASSTSSHASLFRRVASSEPSSYNVTVSSGRGSASMIALTGVDTTTPEDATASAVDTTAGTSIVAPTVTASAGSMLLNWFGGRTATVTVLNTFTPDASADAELIDVASVVSGSSNSGHEVTRDAVTSGATGTRTATAAYSTDWIAYSVVVKPASGGSVGGVKGGITSASATGGGVAVIDAFGPPKSANYSATLTGGGVTSIVAAKSAFRAQALTGGGVAAPVGRKGAQSDGDATGGGVVVLSDRKGGQTSAVMTGGGVASIAMRHGSLVSVAVTGGGILSVAAAHGAQGSVTATGGGVTIIDAVKGGGGAKAAEYVANLTGGGVVSLAVRAGRESSPALTGGGVAVLGSSGAHTASVTITGGGVFTLTYIAEGAEAKAEVTVVPVDMMQQGAGPVAKRRSETPFDDWTVSMDDESILELYLMRKTR